MKSMPQEESIPSFILGMKDKFRGEKLMVDLSVMGFPAQVVYGVDAQLVDPEILALQVDQAAVRMLLKRELSLGEIACAIGHREMYERFLATESPWALMLEDDCVLLRDLNQLVPELPYFDAPTVLQLQVCNVKIPTIVVKQKKIGSGSSSTPSSVILNKKFESSHGSFAYFINRGAAEIAVTQMRGRRIISYADWPFLWKDKVDFWEPSVDFASFEGESFIDPIRKALYIEQKGHHRAENSASRRLIGYLSNLFMVQTIQFSRLGYPARTFYVNRVIYPLVRRLMPIVVRLRN